MSFALDKAVESRACCSSANSDLQLVKQSQALVYPQEESVSVNVAEVQYQCQGML